MTFKDFIKHHFGSTSELARVVGVSPRTGWKYRRCPERMNVTHLVRIAEHTGVDVCEITDIINQSTEKQ